MREDDRNRRRDKAFRILEALSDIDEELPARSEQSQRADASAKVRQIPLRKYKSAAAVLALLAVGTSVYLLGTGMPKRSDGSQAALDIASLGERIEEKDTSPAAGAAPQENIPSAAQNGGTWDLAEEQSKEREEIEGVEAIEELDSANRAEEDSLWEGLPERESAREGAQEDVPTQNTMQDATQGAMQSAIQSATQNAAQSAGLDAYVPETLPDGYRFVSADSGTAPPDGHALALSCVNEAESKRIDLWITDETASLQTVPAEEVTEDTFRADGTVAVLYEDTGVAVRFEGNAEPEVLYRVFTAIRP